LNTVIGITHDTHPDERKGPNPYVQAVKAAGGEPRLLRPEEIGDRERLLGEVQGLLFPGGGDIDPTHYGEEPHADLLPTDPEQDAFELEMMRRAYERDLPTLGICRGMQVMAVALGGKLIQDISMEVRGAFPHRQKADRDQETHPVDIVQESILAGIVEPLRLGVNSFHHQAVARPVPGELRISAEAPDGLIEAVEAPDKSFFVGVQWHPECLLHDERHRWLFRALIGSAASVRQS